ncbi:MAG: hypothetical protein P8188_13690, partial [Gemmatimonadota bacterium]
MKRSLLLVAAASTALAACGPAEVVVTTELESENPATGSAMMRPVSDLEVQLLPFDRDAVFDSLATAYGTPEPEIPAEILAAQEEIASAQEEWRDFENRWNTLRDTLQTISDSLENYNRGEARYVALFNEFGDLDTELSQVERQMNQAFARFDSLQRANIEAAQAIRIERENWANDAFAGVGDVWAEKVRASGLTPAADTTNANGVATFAVKPGQYWVHARYDEVYNELYWNVPLTVEGGDPVTLTLTRDNAEVR